MNQLIWVLDSPFSRALKWLLLSKNVQHEDVLLTWEQMPDHKLLAQNNPKKQVPTLIYNNEPLVDSMLIAMNFLPSDWYKMADATLFRLADCDMEAAIIFLFRANLLREKFGESSNSELMYDSGISTYQSSIDFLLDHVVTDISEFEVNYGAVLLYSTMAASWSLSGKQFIDYRYQELKPILKAIETNSVYRAMIDNYKANPDSEVPYELTSVAN